LPQHYDLEMDTISTLVASMEKVLFKNYLCLVV